MVVGAPDIDELLESPLQFISVIGDVAGKVSELTVALDDRSILVIAIFGRPEPLRSITFVNRPVAAQKLNRLCYLPSFAKLPLAEERVKADAELFQIPANRCEQLFPAITVEKSDCRFLILRKESLPPLLL